MNWRVELRRHPPSIGQPARMQKNAAAANTPEPTKLLTTSDIRPGIFTVASSLERSETDSPLVPYPVLPIANQCQSVTNANVNSSTPSKTSAVFRNSKPLFETQDLPAGIAAFGLSTTLRIGCRRSRGGFLTQTQSPTESFKLQPTSKNCPSPAIPYSFIAPLYFS